jgi:cytosine/adenosine deaminase-related metal-dependent hydrolase
MTALAMQADWIVPIDSAPIANGWIVVDTGEIVYVGPELPRRFDGIVRIRIEHGAILPGWVNAHCHLEFSDLKTPIALPTGGSLVDWLGAVMARRRMNAVDALQELLQARRSAIESGVIESWRTGTRWIVDNVTMPWQPDWLQSAVERCSENLAPLARDALVPQGCLRVQPCMEVMDVRLQRWEETWNACQKQLDAPKYPAMPSLGIAPHAPYTASLEVTRAVARACEARNVLWTMHLAESPEEREWLQSRKGPFAGWIAPHLDENHRRHMGNVHEHLQRWQESHTKGLVVHGNDLRQDEIDTLRASQGRLAVVYCPRTHRFFRHAEHPLPKLLDRSIPVFLGTDSRASNPDLSMWEELRCAACCFPGLGENRLAEMMTIQPARFLGLDVGNLGEGSRSQLTWLPIAGVLPNPTNERNEGLFWQSLLRQGSPSPLETHPAFGR